MKSTTIPFPCADDPAAPNLTFAPACNEKRRPSMSELARFDVQLSEIFDDIQLQMVDDFWAEECELRLQHALPMSKFIQEKVPHESLFIRQKNAYFEDAEAVLVGEIADECVKTVSSAIDIYVRQFINQDFTTKLFRAARSFEDARDIAWIVDQASVSDLDGRSVFGNSIQAADEIYNFCSPAFTWRNGFGERGILVLREDRIVARTLLEVS